MAETSPNQTSAEANERPPEHNVEPVARPPSGAGPEPPPPDHKRDNAKKKRYRTNAQWMFYLQLITVIALIVSTYYTRQLVIDTEQENIATQRAFLFVRGVHYAKIVGPFASGKTEALENFLTGD